MQKALVMGCIALGAGVAHAQDAMTAGALGAGGAMRGDVRETGAIAEAPATLALSGRYDFSFGARLGYGGDVLFQGGIADARTSAIALGLSYARRSWTPPTSDDDLPGWALPDDDLANPTQASEIALSAGTNFLEQRLAFAVVGLRHGWSSRFSEAGARYDLGASIAGRPLPALVLSLSGVDLIGSDAPGGDRHAAVGARYAPELPLSAGVDVVGGLADPSAGVPLSVRGGVEVVVREAVALRGGWQHEGEDAANYFTVGAGVLTPQAALDYGWRRTVGEGPASDSGVQNWHAVTLRFSL